MNRVDLHLQQAYLNETLSGAMGWMTVPRSHTILFPGHEMAEFDMGYSHPHRACGQVKIEILSATNLPIGDFLSSDPFVNVWTGEEGAFHGLGEMEEFEPILECCEKHGSTRVVKTTLDPVWLHSVWLAVHNCDLQNRTILFEVNDHDEIGSADPLGFVALSMDEMRKITGSPGTYHNYSLELIGAKAAADVVARSPDKTKSSSPSMRPASPGGDMTLRQKQRAEKEKQRADRQEGLEKLREVQRRSNAPKLHFRVTYFNALHVLPEGSSDMQAYHARMRHTLTLDHCITGIFNITVLECRHLDRVVTRATCSPFIRITVEGLSQSSHTIDNSLHPVWADAHSDQQHVLAATADLEFSVSNMQSTLKVVAGSHRHNRLSASYDHPRHMNPHTPPWAPPRLRCTMLARTIACLQRTSSPAYCHAQLS